MLVENQAKARVTVSVIIPCYRQAQYLAQAVDSALGQTYSHIEVIVVNDGSDDNAEEVAFTYGGRIRYIRQDNGGLSAARNSGLAVASGNYVMFLDADDALLPAKIEKQIEVFQNDPSIDIVYCDFYSMDLSGSVITDNCSVGKARSVMDGDIFESLLLGGYFPVHAALLRKSLIEQVGGFDTALQSHEDYHLWLRLAGMGCRAKYIDEKLVLYRKYSGSMSTQKNTMDETRTASLEDVVRAYPLRVAKGLSNLQEFYRHLHADLCEREWRIKEREVALEASTKVHEHGFRTLRRSMSYWVGRFLSRAMNG